MLEIELYIKNLLDQMTVLTFNKLDLPCKIVSTEKVLQKEP